MELEQATRTTPQISVLCPTHGRPDRVRALLARLGEQSVPDHAFELILVDDGGDPAVAIDVRELSFECTVIRRRNAGPAAARNAGLALVKAPLVLILNDDAVLAHDLIEQHLFAHRTVDAKTSVLGTFHFTARSCQSPFVQVLDQTSRLFDFDSLVHGKKYPWSHFWTCNISLPASALFEVGGFDEENFDRAICEDTELGYRLQQAGWSVQYNERCVAHHEHVLTPKAYMDRAVILGVYQRRMRLKYPELDMDMGNLPADEFLQERALLRVIRERLPAADEFLGRLEAIEQSHRGTKLAPQLVQEIDAALRVHVMPYWIAGIFKDLTGTNPLGLVRDELQVHRLARQPVAPTAHQAPRRDAAFAPSAV